VELIFQEQKVEFNTTPSPDEVVAQINELLKENYYLSHLYI